VTRAATQDYDRAKAFAASGRNVASAIHLAKAVCADPGEAVYARELAAALSGRSVNGFDADLKEAVRVLLDRPDVPPQPLLSVWHGLLATNPGTRDLFALARCDDYDRFAAELTDRIGRQVIDDSLFLAGLRRLVIPDLVFERFLRHLRRYLLADAGATIPVATATALAAALAMYCHYTGYLLDVSDAEKEILAAFRLEIGYAADLASRRRQICLLACYEPVHRHIRADEISTTFAGDPVLGPMVTELVVKPKAEAGIAASIEPFAAIEEQSSRRVRRQYVEFPYPRWHAAEIDVEPVRRYLPAVPDKELDILVAGCGTGLEAFAYSTAFPTARILAVDLSEASLAYAIRQTAEYGVRNIVFEQADILALPGVLRRKFDIISSSGVLHHMNEPERGFDALRGLLKPGGSMFICLYSEAGRRHVVKAQQAAARHGYPGTDEGIRAFRAACPGLLAEEDLAGTYRFPDFYVMAHCRDLLFNVIEHRFDIPRLKALLRSGGLEFVGFAVPDAVRQRYARMFPEDPGANDLDNWERFEQAYPDTFAGMYKMICRPSIA
jgi:SAM-dependent methyltransferase